MIETAMVLEEKVQRAGEQLPERVREQIEPAVRRLVSELLTIAATERATALQDDRRVADSERQKAVQEESARVRAEVEKTWAVKFREANETADLRFEAGLREAHEEADRTLARRIDQVREETERTIAADLAAAPVASAPESAPAEPETDEVLGRVLDGVRRLDQASRLTDVLDTLAELAPATRRRGQRCSPCRAIVCAGGGSSASDRRSMRPGGRSSVARPASWVARL